MAACGAAFSRSAALTGCSASVARRGGAAVPAAPSTQRCRPAAAQRDIQATYTARPDTVRRPSPLPLRPSSRTPAPASAPLAARPSGPASKLPVGPPPLLRVAFTVPDCRLIFGEQLVLTGSCEALGSWGVEGAPRLECGPSGDSWSVQLALPAGSHTFKLAVLRQDGAAFWEEGPDRELDVPEGAAAVAAKARTGMRVSCRWGDWQAQPEAALAAAAELDAMLAPPPPQQAADSAGATAAGPAAGAGAGLAAAAAAVAPAAAAAATAAQLSAPSALERAARILEPGAGGAAPPAAGGAAPPAAKPASKWQSAMA